MSRCSGNKPALPLLPRRHVRVRAFEHLFDPGGIWTKIFQKFKCPGGRVAPKKSKIYSHWKNLWPYPNDPWNEQFLFQRSTLPADRLMVPRWARAWYPPKQICSWEILNSLPSKTPLWNHLSGGDISMTFSWSGLKEKIILKLLFATQILSIQL